MNQNGQLILKMLENLGEPATITEIVSFIADSAEVDPDEVKDSVMDTVSAGVRYGFIQRKDRKYFTAPTGEYDNTLPEEDGGSTASDECLSDNGSMVERPKRRKQSRRSSKRRSRSRRRRRR